jgi:nucleoside diphosphate kinase
MFAPSPELVKQYSELIISANDPQDRRIQQLIHDYIVQNLSPDPKTGRRRRVMMLLFVGEDAVRKVRGVIGNISFDRRGGETIRDTYGDLVQDDSGQIRYFEPAVLAAPNVEEAETKLKLWARFSATDGGVLENLISYAPDEKPERTLVLIKPDNFRFPTGRPGNMIDFFSRTGLFIVGIKVHRMSVAQALEFYGPVREVLRTKLTDVVAARAKAAIEKELGFTVPPAQEKQLGQLLGSLFGDSQFDNIVKFMAGRTPSECDEASKNQPGTEKCIALVYEGPSAVRKIRDVLGPTDPSKAPPGSIRREFGQTIMVNAAHASDSAENARREMKVIGVAENDFRQVVEDFYGKS